MSALHARFTALLALSLATACGGARSTVEGPNPIPIPVTESLPADVHWVRNSAEYRALSIQIYRMAAERLRSAASGRPPGSWAVIMDADETVLDNSEYQMRLALTGASYASETWNAWVREEDARVVPGAADFIAMVRELGGRVAIVTNRDDEVCDPTRRNLLELDITVDVVLCRTQTSDKNPRFAAVANGTAAPGLSPVSILMWVGDNIQDFPALTQDVRAQGPAAFEAFGRSFILLPNPMYGSWEENERR